MFLLPLIFGVVVSVIFTITMLFLFSQRFAENEDYLSKIKEVEFDKTLPYIDTARIMLYRKFQRAVNVIQIFSQYYELYANELKGNVNETFIKKYAYNIIYGGAHKQELIKNITEQDNNRSYLGKTQRVT